MRKQMADNKKLTYESPEDEEVDREQPLMSHLLELRSRLVRAAVSVLVVFAVLSPFMKHIFDLLSQPLMAALPQGVKMLSTGSLFCSVESHSVFGFSDRVALCVVSGLGFYCAGALQARKTFNFPDSCLKHCNVCLGDALLLLHCFPDGLYVYRRL